ncbi:hypothetical protein BH11MYX4_BH11MYX4_64500 [soil metagenome]
MNHRFLTVFCASVLLAACDETPSDQKHGSLELTTSSVTAEKGFSTGDGWNVKFNHLFVHVSAVTVAGLDGVVTASATAQVVDQAAAGPKTLLSASVRTARPWEDVSFEIAPAARVDDVGPQLVAPVTQGDVDAMVKDGLSLYVEGSATKGAVTKGFKWGFTSDTLHTACTGEVKGAAIPGLVIPPDGVDSADIGMDGSVLFADSLVNAGSSLRFDPLAAADADKDGVVTLEELGAVTLDSLRAAKAGAYVTPDASPIGDLRGFTEENTRRVVISFRAKGSCKSAAPAAP